MSQFVGASLPQFILLEQNDFRNCDEFFFGNERLYFPQKILDRVQSSEDEGQGFSSPYWPSPNGFLGDYGQENPLTKVHAWDEPWYSLGCNGRLGFVGYTRDQYGSPLGGCTVRCFNTATNELTAQVVSDANGYYVATTPYANGHYLVVHKSGSPDIAGASINTLTPA